MDIKSPLHLPVTIAAGPSAAGSAKRALSDISVNSKYAEINESKKSKTSHRRHGRSGTARGYRAKASMGARSEGFVGLQSALQKTFEMTAATSGGEPVALVASKKEKNAASSKRKRRKGGSSRRKSMSLSSGSTKHLLKGLRSKPLRLKGCRGGTQAPVAASLPAATAESSSAPIPMEATRGTEGEGGWHLLELRK